MREFFSRRSGRFRRTAPPSDGPATPAPSALHPPPEPFPSGIKLLHNPSEAALVDIVFVHGLTGHREKTWTAHDATDPWPKTLLPTKIPTARVLTFGYDASVADWRSVVSVNRVGNHAQNLLSALANFREDGDTNERPLIFVCHSLGGIVCEDALVSSLQRPEKHLKAILAATKGIIFMGTPHHGSGLAAWAEKLSMSIGLLKQTNTDIVRVLRSDSETLARIQDSFHTMIQSRNREGQGRIEITCFYEELPLPGVGLVVTQDSAILPGYVPIGLRNNHQDMTKFSALEDPGFIAVCAELRRWNKEMRMPSTLQAPIIHESSKIRESELPQAHFIVPYNENIDFIGRHQILNQLRQDFQHDPRCSKEKGRSRISLYGLGGIGKTQIALAYAYWLRDVRPDISIFWVHASNPERFQQAFMRIAEECNIPDHQNPSVDILSLVHAWLLRSKHAPWFMIIDNADDTSMFFQDVQKIPRMSVLNAHEKSTRTLGQFVPECRHGSILITTRNKQAGQRLAPGRPPFEVPKLNDEESAQMIRIMTGDGQLSLMTASNLSSQLEHLPLAIAQASAFIQENSMTIERYQELLNESDKTVARLLSAEFGTVGQDSAIPRSVMSTWVVSFEQIKKQSPLAIEILSLIAFFDRQAIPIGLLSVYFDKEILVEVETAIGILKAFCIISISKEREKHFDLHRLVQLATKRWIQEEESHEKFAAGALQTLAQAFPDGTFESMSVCKSLLPHAHAVLENKCRQIYEDALAAATIRRDLSSFYVNTGQLEVAAKISQRNLASSKLILGETNPVLLKVMRQLIEIYKYLGDYENSKELFEKLLPLQHEVFPNDHSEVLHGTLISAKEHRSQGSFTEAERLLRGALYQCNMHAMDERMYFSVRIRLMLELALVLSDAGHFELAKEWSLQTEKITRHTFGKHHPLALRVYWALACIYKQQGQLENAAETCRRALNDRDITHDHAQTLLLDVKALLGAVLHDQGWLEEAGRIQSEILDIANTFYKQDPLRILDFMNPLVATREAQGRLQEACELKSQVVEIATTLLGPDHPGVVEHTRLLAVLDEKRDIGGIEYKSSSSDVA
ncbi:Kinesin light chain [Colletotrichum asianum]